MHQSKARQSRADEAALQAYFRLRAAGQAHQRALSAAILSVIQGSEAIDGREARIRVVTALRARGVIPTDREDWIRTAVSSDSWGRGARAAIAHLSSECRRPFPEHGIPASPEFEMVGAGFIAEYLRAQMPEKIARLRREVEVMRLFAEPANSPH